MDLLTEFAQVENYIIEISNNEILTDEILIKIGTSRPSDALREEIINHFRAKMRVVPKIEFHPVETIEQQLYPKGSRKPVKFIDHRTSIK